MTYTDLVAKYAAKYPDNVSLDGSGNLVITDDGSMTDALTIQADTANSRYVISDPNYQFGIADDLAGVANSPNSQTIYVPFSAVKGGAIIVNSEEGKEILTVNYSLGSFAAQGKTIQFNGKSGGTNILVVAGTVTTQETFDFTGATGGDVQIGNASGTSKIDYVNVSGVNSTISAFDVTINLPPRRRKPSLQRRA